MILNYLLEITLGSKLLLATPGCCESEILALLVVLYCRKVIVFPYKVKKLLLKGKILRRFYGAFVTY